jgi:hypothetical protein
MLPFSPSQLPIRTAVPAILLVTAVDQPCRPGITAFDFEESNLQRHGKPTPIHVMSGPSTETSPLPSSSI